MFYAGAVEGADRWIKPSDVRKMSDSQARQLAEGERRVWLQVAHSKERIHRSDLWPADREQVRDETLRPLYEKFGAVRWRESEDLSATADIARWALSSDFGALFLCGDDEFETLSKAGSAGR